ncbi:hypothetical protein [Streptomyces sp. MZ04]|uniref:SpnB-like Rossmann fold domain-containing protein n=1 Tax=Streptomyces sp. MZ04 TaxID=2559236 RepID=UPI00107E8759|nr:hypothetical protein [Streptomyces sp. MZ04]TGB14469.1 hypothetical protein E2651_05810 [Streptomyces sp. MZ04]
MLKPSGTASSEQQEPLDRVVAGSSRRLMWTLACPAPEWTALAEDALQRRAGSSGAGWAIAGPDLFGMGMALTGAAWGVELHSGLDSLGSVLKSGARRPAAVVLPVAPDMAGLARATRLARCWLDDERFRGCRLTVVTRGAVTAVTCDEAPDPAPAAVWEAVRALLPRHTGRLALLDLGAAGESMRRLAKALLCDADELALRSGEVLMRRQEAAAGGVRRAEARPLAPRPA